jgi:hypothetical protein
LQIAKAAHPREALARRDALPADTACRGAQTIAERPFPLAVRRMRSSPASCR